MLRCDLTLSSPAENLALDEALLDTLEESGGGELLRLWEPAEHFVVVGYANAVTREVNVPFCQAAGIPVLRRCSGGGTVLQGPGCLNYSLIVRISESGPFRTIHTTNQEIMERHRAVVADLTGLPVEVKGHTDLAVRGVKFSGNAQRRKRAFLIFHGAFLLSLDISLVERTLRMPSKQPDYRSNRPHSDFLMNLGIGSGVLKEALVQAWQAAEPLRQVPLERMADLARAKYTRAEWNLKF
jgi:lipoate-protein ligase A